MSDTPIPLRFGLRNATQTLPCDEEDLPGCGVLRSQLPPLPPLPRRVVSFWCGRAAPSAAGPGARASRWLVVSAGLACWRASSVGHKAPQKSTPSTTRHTTLSVFQQAMFYAGLPKNAKEMIALIRLHPRQTYTHVFVFIATDVLLGCRRVAGIENATRPCGPHDANEVVTLCVLDRSAAVAATTAASAASGCRL